MYEMVVVFILYEQNRDYQKLVENCIEKLIITSAQSQM